MSAVTIDKPLHRWVTQDFCVNQGWDSRAVVFWFRLAQFLVARAGFAGRCFGFAYRMFTTLFVGVELAPNLAVGPRLRIHHPQSIVVNDGAVIGADCTLRQNVTIGNITRRDGSTTGAPVIGDGVEFGAGAVVIGDVTIGDHAKIGALALVRTDVPAAHVAVGNPARVLPPRP